MHIRRTSIRQQLGKYQGSRAALVAVVVLSLAVRNTTLVCLVQGTPHSWSIICSTIWDKSVHVELQSNSFGKITRSQLVERVLARAACSQNGSSSHKCSAPPHGDERKSAWTTSRVSSQVTHVKRRPQSGAQVALFSTRASPGKILGSVSPPPPPTPDKPEENAPVLVLITFCFVLFSPGHICVMGFAVVTSFFFFFGPDNTKQKRRKIGNGPHEPHGTHKGDTTLNFDACRQPLMI